MPSGRESRSNLDSELSAVGCQPSAKRNTGEEGASLMETLLPHQLLSLLIFLPTAGAVLLLLFPASKPEAAKWFAFGISVVEFLISIPLWTRFEVDSGAFQFVERIPWIPSVG